MQGASFIQNLLELVYFQGIEFRYGLAVQWMVLTVDQTQLKCYLVNWRRDAKKLPRMQYREAREWKMRVIKTHEGYNCICLNRTKERRGAEMFLKIIPQMSLELIKKKQSSDYKVQ